MFEQVLKDLLTNYLESNDLLENFEYWFRQGWSCLNSVVNYHEEIHKTVEDGGNMNSVYLDFSKNFHKEDYFVLFNSHRDLRICMKTSVWIHSFLVDRTQAVFISGKLSRDTEVRSGVPQGSVIGP